MSIIDVFYSEGYEVLKYLDGEEQISYRNIYINNFRKSLLLAIASYFEEKVTGIITKFCSRASNENQLLISFIKKKQFRASITHILIGMKKM